MWETIELHELRAFLTLAEELHFGRSAERLRLTQSRVSQILRQLEHKLGGQLVHRTSRRVTLTPLGERFQTEVGAAYEGLASVLERTHAAGRTLDGTLRLGLLSPTSGGPHLAAIIDAFEKGHPACKVEISEVPLTDPLGPLRRDEIDLMSTRLPLRRPDIVIGPTLSREPRVLAVARDHPLAEREQVSIEDVADYLVAPFMDSPKETLEALIPHATPAGRPIRRMRRRLRTPYEVTTLIARGSIVHPRSPRSTSSSGIPTSAMSRSATCPRRRPGSRGCATQRIRGWRRSSAARGSSPRT
jgi:DNA-binding transcriptional LysR family regulator